MSAAPRLFVLGNAGLDIALPVPRLPRPGETLVGGAATRAPGGKGLNQAVVAARTGLLPVHFRAPVGNDADGQTVAARLRGEAFAALDLPMLSVATDLSVLMATPDGENCIVTSGACAATLGPADAAEFAARSGPGDTVLLQGNLSAAATDAALRAARARGAATMLNTAPLFWDMRPVLPGRSAVIANAVEAEALTDAVGADAAWALHRAGAALALVTMGEGGCLLADATGVRFFPAAPAESVDTTGAGDTFCGVLAVLLARGTPVPDAIEAGQRAAALTVERQGAFDSLPSAEELRALLPAGLA